MKWMTALALIVGVNIGLLMWGERALVWSGRTADQWAQSCRYYYPLRTFVVTAPLTQSCPRWVKPD